MIFLMAFFWLLNVACFWLANWSQGLYADKLEWAVVAITAFVPLLWVGFLVCVLRCEWTFCRRLFLKRCRIFKVEKIAFFKRVKAFFRVEKIDLPAGLIRLKRKRKRAARNRDYRSRPLEDK